VCFLHFLCFIDRASLYNLVNKTNVVHNFSLCVYFCSLHVSGATCPSSGELTVSMEHLVFVTLKQVNSLNISPYNFKLFTCFRVTNNRCCIDTVNSPDDGHIAPETCRE
jgi:hypothetical protein